MVIQQKDSLTIQVGEGRVVMRKKMISMTVFSLIALVAAGVTYALTQIRPLFSVAITFGTIFYHLAVRLVIGGLIDAKYHNRMDYRRKWFQEKSFEKKLY